MDNLTGAERDIVRLVAAGRATREIARERQRSIHTVRAQINSLNRKLQLTHRTQLVLWAVRHGFGGVL
jgi:NarL family two-component system response regulator LiaR